MGWVDRDGDMPFTVDCEEHRGPEKSPVPSPSSRQGHAALTEYREHIKAARGLAQADDPPAHAGEPMRDPTQIIPAEFG
jgi:hypothetical protein